MNEATPAPAATPSTPELNSNPPSVTPPAPATPAPETNPEGTVTIPVKDFAQLNRDAARARSFTKRVYKKPINKDASATPADPENAALNEANQRADEAESKVLQSDVRNKVRGLLTDDRFKIIPESTKEIILESPHMLTKAETLDEAMYDIEDKLVDIAEKLGTDQETTPEQTPQVNTPENPPAVQQPAVQQPGHQTPPVVTPGSPAPVDSAVLENTENLRGSARSVAVLNNSFKKQRINIGGNA